MGSKLLYKNIFVFLGNSILVTLCTVSGFVILKGLLIYFNIAEAIRIDDSSSLNYLIRAGIQMGIFISFAGLADVFSQLPFSYFNGQHERSLLITVLLLLFFLYVSNFSALLLPFATIGLCLTSLGLSNSAKKIFKSGEPFSWTMGHVIGTGLLPMLAGYSLICFNNWGKISLLSQEDGKKFYFVILIAIGLFIIVAFQVSFIALHKRFEQNPPFNDRNGAIDILKRYTGTDKDSPCLKMLKYYMWILYLFPLTILILYIFINLNFIFLIISFLSYFLIICFYFDYPYLLCKNKNISITIRIIATFMLVGSIAIDYIANLNTNIILPILDISPITFSIAIFTLLTRGDIKCLFYKRRINYLVVCVLILSLIFSIKSILEKFNISISERLNQISTFSYWAIIGIILFMVIYIYLAWQEKLWWQTNNE